MTKLRLCVAALAVGLVLMGCNTQNVEPPQSKEQAATQAESSGGPMDATKMPAGHPPIGQMPSGQMPSGQMPLAEGEGPSITGTISLAPELADKASSGAVLYIIARQEGMNAPVAVSRLQEVTFPVDYSLNRQHMMGTMESDDAKVNVTARLDKDGFVGPTQPGDIEGSYSKNPVSMGDSNIDITLDKLQ